MTDSTTIAFEIINTIIAFGGILLTFYGQHYFKGGVLVGTLKRGSVVAVLLFTHFLLETLNDVDMIQVPDLVNHLLELGFTVGLAYLTFAFIKDWQNLETI